MKPAFISCLLFGLAAAAAPGHAQTLPPASPTSGTSHTSDAAQADSAKEEGFVIQDQLVRSRCGGCHRADDKGRMTRISYRRATPENWERTIKRMVALNHATLSPEDARTILKYLADHQGLAPEELRPIAFEEERRTIDFPYKADETTANLCSSCHSIARVLSERRTKAEWDLLIAMHRGYYPLVDSQPMNGPQGFMRSRSPQTDQESDGRPPDDRHPVDRAVEHLAKTLPLMTAEWSAWSAAMQPPKLAGTWAISGYQTGLGPIYGQVTVTADSTARDAFTTSTRYIVARTGETVTRAGKALVYAGYQWRGRAPGAADNAWREVMFIERDWKEMWGRWFTGAYDETGIDVKLTRLGSEPAVLGASVSALKTGSTAQNVRIFGLNLPSAIRPDEIGLGQGVTVTGVVSARPEELSVTVDVAPTAPVGARDGSVAGTVKPALFVVYDKIDAIKVVPLSGMARVGGAVFPKQFQQFEAIGISYGPDGKPETADDLSLGIVPVKWSLEEYPTTFGDDDLQYVGTLDQKGLFTPNLDGPNPKRSGNRDNVGDVWVVAELVPALSRPVRARAHLLVTVPLYMNWFSEDNK